MPHIQVLDQITIDKIAAGEVIERPASIVKELVENAIDAGSTSVKVEIKDGGISLIRIMDNGCGVAGTPLEYISGEARQLLESADVILSKGQGNFETMHGCGLNVYYSFLCKCEWFQKRFGMEKNRGVFITEKAAAVVEEG